MANKQIRGIWFHLIMVITIIGMGCLSAWQFHRLVWKNAVIAEINQHFAQHEIELDRLSKLPLPEWSWRRVYVPPGIERPPANDDYIKLTVTEQNGFGWRPVWRSPDGQWLMVGRWQPIGTPLVPTRLDGAFALIKPVQAVPPFVQPNDAAKQNWYRVDQKMMAVIVPQITTHYAELLPTDQAIYAPLPNNNHLQYAITWAVLAVIIAAMYVHLLRRV